jgi:hypothetical protein
MLNFLVSAASATLSVVSAALPAVARFCVAMGPRIAAVISSPQTWQIVGNILSVVAQVLHIFRPGETVEEIGDRAMQAAEKDGITSDDFDEWDDYMDAIRNFDLDPAKSASYSTLDKTISGLATAFDGMERKFDLPDGMLSGMALLVAKSPDYFTAERLLGIVAVTKDIASIVDYFSGKLDADDSAAIAGVLTKVDQTLNPGKDESASEAELNTVSEQFKHE